MRTVRTDILSEIRRSHRPDAGPVHSERTAGKGSHTAGNRSSAEDHCGANRNRLGEPVKLGVRKKIWLVAVDLPKGTSYRRKPRSGGRTPQLGNRGALGTRYSWQTYSRHSNLAAHIVCSREGESRAGDKECLIARLR